MQMHKCTNRSQTAENRDAEKEGFHNIFLLAGNDPLSSMALWPFLLGADASMYL